MKYLNVSSCYYFKDDFDWDDKCFEGQTYQWYHYVGQGYLTGHIWAKGDFPLTHQWGP